ncbi:MAG: LPS export ABC transporter permease LptG [Pseudomonadota bacterium]
MGILDRYLVKAILQSVALVLLVLLALGIFVSFVGQLDNIGTGTYDLTDAVVYVLLTIPKQAFDMLPVAALLGTLLALGQMATHSELIVMRASGISLFRMSRTVLIAGVLLAMLAGTLGEFIAPPAEQYARSSRALALDDRLSIAGGRSAWIKDQQTIINVDELRGSQDLGGVYLFEFDEAHQLKRISRAASADVGSDGEWRLSDIQETTFESDKVSGRSVFQRDQPTILRPELVGLSVVDPDSLASRGLRSYVSYLQQNALDSHRYEVAYWSRLSEIASVIFMTALALPFAFGSLRSAGTGQRLLVGVLIGVAYVLASKTMSNSGEVFGFNPFVAAWLPALSLALLSTILIWRTR